MALKLRCAIYARKSTEEGLEQHFNSLDAQREACEAYVRSQGGEGWTLIKQCYTDGGYSGGSIERPGLQKLLADVAAAKVDVVVVYKVDRLTRSLADFAKIVEAFDAKGVSFVSVTQSFNTTTSMGRLTLNVLLSFAQFEREVTGERIRDKIAASKARGMWMGGNLPLGYNAPVDPQTRALVVNEAEADTVRLIFRRYQELGSVHELKRWLDERGIVSKRRLSSGGRERGGVPFSRGALFHLLKNRTYLGEVPHRERSYPGAHPPIVDRQLFEEVRSLLASQARRRAGGTSRSSAMLLKGRLFDAAGAPMSPTFTRGAKRQEYRYYVSTSRQQGRGVTRAEIVTRVSAEVIEGVVRKSVAAAGGRDPEIRDAVQRVVLRSGAVHILAAREKISGGVDPAADVVALKRRLPADHRVELDPENDEVCWIVVPAHLTLRGGRTVITDASGRVAEVDRRSDPTLIRALKSAHALLGRVGGVAGRPEEGSLAAAPSNAYERNLLKLAFLSPDLQAEIVEGRQPPGLTLQSLISSPLPAAWDDQRAWAASLT